MEWLSSIWDAFAQALLSVLPTSPFAGYIDAFRDLPFLGWINWFVPVRAILTVLASWLGAVALFYLYSIAMRWLKIIGD